MLPARPNAPRTLRRQRPGRPSAALLLLVLAWTVGCAEDARPARNLVLVSIDTLRADRLGCYGYGRDTSPTLDAIAASGVLFEDASAPSSWTLPSHASMLTGLYPQSNGVTSVRHELAPEANHLAALLAERGFATGAIVSSSLVTTNGLERGFARIVEADRGGPHPSDVSQHAIAWLEARDEARPFFLLVHYIDPHSDYGSLPEFRELFVGPYDGHATGASGQLYAFLQGSVSFDERDVAHLSDLYDAGIRQMDGQIRLLHDHLAAEGMLTDTLLVITSDHGEEFGEHGGLMHGQTQYDEVVRIPLLVSGPGVPAGRRVASPVSLTDVMPTCLRGLGLPLPDGLDGVALQDAWEGELDHVARRLYFGADLDPPTEKGVMLRGNDQAIRERWFKLHFNNATKELALYDLRVDPGETTDVQAKHPAVVAELLRDLKRFQRGRRNVPVRELGPKELEHLRQLGYAGEE